MRHEEVGRLDRRGRTMVLHRDNGGIWRLDCVASGFAIGLLIVVIVAGVLAWKSWQKADEREYLLFVMTSSSEAQAYTTRSRAQVYDLRDQIEMAMMHQARVGG